MKKTFAYSEMISLKTQPTYYKNFESSVKEKEILAKSLQMELQPEFLPLQKDVGIHVSLLIKNIFSMDFLKSHCPSLAIKC